MCVCACVRGEGGEECLVCADDNNTKGGEQANVRRQTEPDGAARQVRKLRRAQHASLLAQVTKNEARMRDLPASAAAHVMWNTLQ